MNITLKIILLILYLPLTVNSQSISSIITSLESTINDELAQNSIENKHIGITLDEDVLRFTYSIVDDERSNVLEFDIRDINSIDKAHFIDKKCVVLYCSKGGKSCFNLNQDLQEFEMFKFCDNPYSINHCNLFFS